MGSIRGRNTLGGLQSCILSEISKHLDISDLIHLRLISKHFNILLSAQSLWLTVAQNLATTTPLPLPPGRRLSTLSVPELISATLRAAKLYKLLHRNDSLGIQPAPVVKSLTIPWEGANEIKTSFVEGGKYLMSVVFGDFTCWDIVHGKPVAQLNVYEDVFLYRRMIRIEDDGSEVLDIAVHLCPWSQVNEGVIPWGGRIAVFEGRLSGATGQGNRSLAEVFSLPLHMSVSGLAFSDENVTLVGQSLGTSMLNIILINISSKKHVMIGPDHTLPPDTSLSVFTSTSELVSYRELEDTCHIIAYNRERLMDAPNGSSKPQVPMAVPPSRLTTFQFDEDSRGYSSGLWNTFVSHDSWLAPHLSTSHLAKDDDTIIVSHILDHLYDPRESLRHRTIYTIPSSNLPQNYNSDAMIWPMPGYVVYAEDAGDGDVRLKLLVLPSHDRNSRGIPRSYTLDIPPQIDFDGIASVNFDHVWGRLVLITADSTLYIFELL